MDRTRRLTSTFVLIVSTTVACARNRAPQELPSHPLLRELAREDQASRRGDSTITRTDEDRIKLVLAELGSGAVRTPEDRFYAALVLQHTGFAFCDGKLVSASPFNYLLAHHLAKSAFEAGHADARQLVAQTIDRYLSMTEGYQKYGTSRLNDLQTGREELPYIDRDTPDSERAKYGVPPLAELLRRYPERPRPAKPAAP